MNTFWPAALLKRDSNTCFPVKFATFLRTFFLTEHLWWLLLIIQIRSSNIQNDVIRMKCWIKQRVNQSNIKIVLNEPENAKQMSQCCCMGTYISKTPHMHMYNEFPYYTMVSCNSSLKSHRSCHHRCSTKKLFLKILQNSRENTCVFNKVASSSSYFFRNLLQN